MPAVVNENELYRACQILFGHDLPVNREFLEYLQLAGVKSAFRQRARETHPDMAVHLAEHELHRCAEQFRAVCRAHENLINYLDARDKGFRFPPVKRRFFSRKNLWSRLKARARKSAGDDERGRFRPRRGEARSGSRRGFQGRLASPRVDIDKLYRGPMPSRRLLLGHYLYYAGIIDWQTIVRALVWQRTKRPRLGEIGCSFGWLREDDILPILRQCKVKQPFGQSAVNLGLLTEVQLKTILFRQQRLQRKFGEYFTETNILTPGKLTRLIAGHKAHNAGFRRRL